MNHAYQLAPSTTLSQRPSCKDRSYSIISITNPNNKNFKRSLLPVPPLPRNITHLRLQPLPLHTLWHAPTALPTRPLTLALQHPQNYFVLPLQIHLDLLPLARLLRQVRVIVVLDRRLPHPAHARRVELAAGAARRLLSRHELDGAVEFGGKLRAVFDGGPDDIVVAFFAHGEFGELRDEVPCLVQDEVVPGTLVLVRVLLGEVNEGPHVG